MKKIYILSLLALSLLFPHFVLADFIGTNGEPQQSIYDTKISSDVNNQGYGGNEGVNYLQNYAVGQGNAALANKFMSMIENGKARLGFFFDSDNNITGEGDVVLPMYNGELNNLFLQVGARTMEDSRWIVNLGFGHRYLLSDDWLIGYNTFLDQDITRNHTRAGAGVELWQNYIRFSSNYYMPVSKWHLSEDFDNYKERAARGWDVRLKGYLPFYPQIAVNLEHSQWYGKNVAIFSKDKLEKDPKIWTCGVEYSPVKMITTSVNHRMMQGGDNDTEFGMQMRYNFGETLESQLSFDNFAKKSVKEDRFDFINRENRIFLEYKAIPQTRVAFLYLTATSTILDNGETDDLLLHLSGLDRLYGHQVIWEIVRGSELVEFVSTSNVTDSSGLSSSKIRAKDSGFGEVVIRAVLDGISTYLSIQVAAHAPDFSIAAPTSVAKTTEFTAILSIENNTLTREYDIEEWTIENALNGASIDHSITSSDGQTTNKEARITLKINEPVTVRIKAKIMGKTVFADVEVTERYSLAITPAHTLPLKLGESINFALLVSGMTHPEANTVLWTIGSGSNGSGQYYANTTAIDVGGNSNVVFTANSVGSVLITATINGVQSVYSIEIVNDPKVFLSVSPSSLVVGQQAQLDFLLSDVINLSNQPVSWTILSGNTLGTLANTSTSTDAQGKSLNTLTARDEGTIQIQATVQGVNAVVSIDIVEDIRLNLSGGDSIYIDDNDTLTLRAYGIDEVKTVNWSIDNTNGSSLASLSTVTDANNTSTNSFSSKLSGTYLVSAEVDGVVSSKQIIVSPATVDVSSTTPTMDIFANSTARLSLFGLRSMSGYNVTWSSSDETVVSIQGSSTGTTASDGTSSIDIKAQKTGTATLTANVVINDVLTITDSMIINVIDTNAVLEVGANPRRFDIGGNSDLTFAIRGIANNQNIPLNWALDANGQANCSFLSQTTSTDSSGQATANISCAKSGTYNVTITSLGKTVSTTLTVRENPSVAVTTPLTTIKLGQISNVNAVLSKVDDISGKQIDWAISGIGAVDLSVASSNTDASGLATVSIVGKTPGNIVINGTHQTGSGSVTINVIEDPKLNGVLSSGNINIGESVNLSTILSGVADVSSKPISWSIVSGVGVLNTTSSTTDIGGVAINSFTATKDGQVVIQAQYQNGVTATFTINVSENPNIELTSDVAAINTTGVSHLSAKISGVSNLSGHTITWLLQSGSGTLTVINAVTDANGVSTANFSSNVATISIVMATFDGVDDVTTVAVSLAPPTASLIADISNPSVGNTVTMIYQAQGATTGDTVHWSISGSGGALLSSSTSTISASGSSSVTLQANVAGAVVVNAYINSGSQDDVSYTVNIYDRLLGRITTASNTWLLGENKSFVLQLSGTATLSRPVTWSVVSGASLVNIISPDATTDTGGRATITLNAIHAGNLVLQANIDGVVASYSIAILEHPMLSIEPLLTTVYTGDSTIINLALTGADTLNGNNIVWSVDNNTLGNLSDISISTNALGVATAKLNTTASGTIMITATTTVGGATVQDTTYVTIVDNYAINFINRPANLNLNGTVPLTMQLTNNGRVVSGSNVVWSVNMPNIAELDKYSDTTNALGQSTVNILAKAVGNFRVTATAAGISTQARIDVVDNFAVTLSADKNSLAYGAVANLTATVSNSNLLAGRNVTWEIVSGQGVFVGIPTVTTVIDGTARAVLQGTGVGAVRVKVTVDGVIIYIDINVNNTIASNISTQTNRIVVGTSGSVKFQLSNFNGLAADGIGVNWQISDATVGSLSANTSQTAIDGSSTINFTGLRAGTFVITATDAKFGKTASLTITVINGATLTLNANPTTIYVGGTSNLSLNIVGGISILGQNVLWRIENQGVSGSAIIADVQSQTDASGNATAKIIGLMGDNIIVSAEVGGVKVFKNISIVQAPTVSLTALQYSTIVGGDVNLTATLGNLLPSISNQQVSWSIVSGNGTLSNAIVSTDLLGIATAKLTANGIGTITVRASIGGYSATVNISVIEIPIVTLNVDKNSIYVNNYTTLHAQLGGLANLNNQSVTWSIVSGNGHFGAKSSTTTSSGSANAIIYGDAAGVLRVKVTINGVSIFVNIQVNSGAICTISASSNEVGENKKITFTAALTNILPAVNVPVLWEVVEGENLININGKDLLTDVNGLAKFTIHNKGIGRVTVKATILGSYDTYTIILE